MSLQDGISLLLRVQGARKCSANLKACPLLGSFTEHGILFRCLGMPFRVTASGMHQDQRQPV